MGSVVDWRTLRSGSLAAVNDLIPCDLVAFDNFSEEERLPVQWHNNHELLTPRITDVCSQIFDDHPYDSPLVREQIHNKFSGVLKLSDFGKDTGFAKTIFYNEVLRPIEVEHQMGVVLSAGLNISVACSVNRKSRDFSERERGLLTLVAPHLANAIKNIINVEKMRENELRLEGLLEASACGAIVLTEDGSVIQITDLAHRLVVKYFGAKPDANALPEGLRRLGYGNGTSAGNSFILPAKFGETNSQLCVSKVFNADTRETNLLLEEKHSLSPFELRSLGLTQRQAEVLFWIAQGKTDEVIALFCEISTRTVQKHVENIYTKLGVETRTAAMLRALQLT